MMNKRERLLFFLLVGYITFITGILLVKQNIPSGNFVIGFVICTGILALLISFYGANLQDTDAPGKEGEQ